MTGPTCFFGIHNLFFWYTQPVFLVYIQPVFLVYTQRVQRAAAETLEPLKNKGRAESWTITKNLHLSGKRKSLYVLYKYIVGAAAALIDGAACSA